jgi:hypothetical protein
MGLGQIRRLIYEQRAGSISMPLVVVFVFWITVIFISFCLFAPLIATVVASLIVSALSLSSAIFLILVMYMPYAGLIHVSSAPLRAASHSRQLARFQRLVRKQGRKRLTRAIATFLRSADQLMSLLSAPIGLSIFTVALA